MPGPALDACAKFLNIEITDGSGLKLFTNKPSLANRIILEIQSLFPATCGECLEQYSIEHKAATTLSLRCFLCFQECHDCEQMTALLPDVSLPIPSGSVWLCKSCHDVNNPTKPRKDRSRAPSSKSTSQAGSTSGTLKIPQQVTLSSDELARKLQEALNKQRQDDALTPQETSEEHLPLAHPPFSEKASVPMG